MKIKLLSTFVLFSSQISFSQTISGKIVFNNYTIPNVEIINSNSRTLCISDANGNFSITAKMNDTLLFIAKNYELKKIIVNPFITNDKNLIIELTLKAEELKEVVITKIPSIKLSKDAKYEQEKLAQYALEKAANRPKVIGVNMGTIDNGIDFIAVGSLLGGLFKKEKEPVKKEKNIIPFKDLAKTSCDQNYFLETLKLKPDEIELFLEFCDADPNSKNIATSNNILVTMDFLFKKNLEFKKLHTSE